MFKIICFCALLCLASANPLKEEEENVSTTTGKYKIVPVVEYKNAKQEDGSFAFSFLGGDESSRQETGVVRDAGTEDQYLEVSGSYKYIDADGKTVEVHYTAGKNGFVPTGTNILDEITAVAKAAADLPKLSDLEKEDEKSSSKAQESS